MSNSNTFKRLQVFGMQNQPKHHLLEDYPYVKQKNITKKNSSQNSSYNYSVFSWITLIIKNTRILKHFNKF